MMMATDSDIGGIGIDIDIGDNGDADTDDVHIEDEEQCCSTVVDELEKKYLSDEVVDAAILLYSMTGTSPCKLASEKALRLLVLNHKQINRVGDEMRFASIAENVTEVDFAWNKLSEWCEVSTLLSLPNIRVLNLSHNPLSAQIETNLPCAQLLHTLIMNATNVPMQCIRKLLESAPSLSELHLSENSELESMLELCDDNALSRSVEVLHVNRCAIQRWPTIMLLRHLFPACYSMFIAENPIEKICFDSTATKTNTMNGVHQLNINKCLLNEWCSVEALAHIATLRHLRIAHNPVLAKLNAEEKMHLVIARIPSLQVLNGSTITEEQRDKAERFFIRYYEQHEVKPTIYANLVAKHGKLEQLCKVDLSPRKYANVIAFCEETGFRANVKIRLDHSVCSLMRTLEKHTGIAVQMMRLHLLSAQSRFCEELRSPHQKLSSLRIEDGDEFIVQSKVVFSRRKQSSSTSNTPPPRPQQPPPSSSSSSATTPS